MVVVVTKAATSIADWDDADACTADLCNPSAGCQHAAVDCQDGNACTDDSCDALAGCLHLGVVCSGDGCAGQVCNAALGCVVPDTPCDDADAQQGDAAGAKEALALAHQRNPDGADTLFELTAALIAGGDLEQALGYLEQLYRQNPASVDVLVRIGEVQERREEMGIALEAYQRALAAMKGSPQRADAVEAVTQHIRDLSAALQPDDEMPKGAFRIPASQIGHGAEGKLLQKLMESRGTPQPEESRAP